MICGLIFFIAFAVFAGILYSVGKKYHDEWKAMVETPTSKVVDIEPGRVEVKGKIVPIPGKMEYAPLTANECVQFEVITQEYRSSGKSHYWATIHKVKRGGPFLVEDDSGKVLVDPEGAGLDKVQTMETQQGMFADMNANAQSHIKMHGIREKGYFGVFKRKLKVVESIIPVGKDIYVLGDAIEEDLGPVLNNDLLVSPFMIKKKGLMILSYTSEKGLTLSKKRTWKFHYITAIVLGSIGLVGGVILAILV
jgi:hypothetical protein